MEKRDVIPRPRRGEIHKIEKVEEGRVKISAKRRNDERR